MVQLNETNDDQRCSTTADSDQLVTNGGSSRSNKSAAMVKELRDRFLEEYKANEYEGEFPCCSIKCCRLFLEFNCNLNIMC